MRSLTSLKGSPHQLASAFGIGIALGVIPGTGAIFAAAAATALRLNLPLMVMGALLTNPATTPLVYGGSYFLGRWLLGEWVTTGTILRLLLGTLAGNLILAVGAGAAGYVIVWALVTWIRVRRRSSYAAGH